MIHRDQPSRNFLMEPEKYKSWLRILLIIAVIVVCFFNTSCHRSADLSQYINVPPPPVYDSNLTNEDIEYLLAGSVDPQVDLISWEWIEELIRHGNETEVQIALNNAAVPNHRYRIQATFALFFIKDDPSSIYTSILDMLKNGTEKEKSNIRFLLPFVLSRESDSQYIPETLELLTSDDPLVRETVIQIIANFPDEPGVIQSIYASSDDTNSRVRYQVGTALIIIGRQNSLYLKNPEGRRVLTQLMLNDDWQGGKAAAYTAAAYCLDDPFIVSFLTERLQQDPDPITRWGILNSLDAVAPRELALPLLRMGLVDPDPMVRKKAEDALGYTKLRKYANIAGLIFGLIVLAAISTLYIRRLGQIRIREE